MKMKFGAIVTDGRGKIGGQVASKNRSGAYLRTKVTPVNRQSPGQSVIRNRMSTISQSWRILTEDQRSAWNSAVADFTKTNIFGDLVTPTGFNLYGKLNNNLIRIGESPVTMPPTPAGVTDIIIGVASAAAAAGTISLAYTPGANAGSVVEVWATPPQSAGKSFVKAEFRLVSSFVSNAASPKNLAANYTTKFGAITGSSGMKIFLKTVAVNSTTGQAGVPQSTSTIIAA